MPQWRTELGPRLRAARNRSGLTLDELSQRCGMSTSTLSRLESGKRQATLELLVPLTRELGVSIDDLVSPSAPDPRVRRAVIRRDGMVLVPLTPELAPIHAYEITYLPVDATPSPRTHDGFEWLYVLAGKLRLLLGEQEYTLARGEAAEFDTSVPHAMFAVGSRPAKVISIFDESGARFHTRTS